MPNWNVTSVLFRTCFTGQGMQPDPKKVSSVQDWPTPTDVITLRQFIGLASYYQRYINKFAEIANPLHNLTQKMFPPCGPKHVLQH